MRIYSSKEFLALYWFVILGFASMALADGPGQHVRIDDNWKFTLGDPTDAATSGFDDSNWRSVALPHDWSIEGEVDRNAPAGGNGGLFPAGLGWSRPDLGRNAKSPKSRNDKGTNKPMTTMHDLKYTLSI